jgi:CRP-like cAMP-binding protein
MHQNKSKNEHLEFLQKLAIFEGWSLGNLDQLYFQFLVQNYTKNHVFYKEGDESTFFYFIRTGEIEANN